MEADIPDNILQRRKIPLYTKENSGMKAIASKGNNPNQYKDLK